MSPGETARRIHLDDARCADLVLGLTPVAEREAALAHVSECSACEERLRAHAMAAERARADRPANAGARVLPMPLVRPHVPMRRALSFAAAAAIVIALAIPILGRLPNKAEKRHWLPALGEQVRTREGELADPRLTAGLEAYAAHDLERANRELSAAHATGGAEQMRRLYLAHVRLALGDPRGATALLQSLEWRTVPEPWRREGIALLARALRRDGRRTAADSIERALKHVEPGTPFLP